SEDRLAAAADALVTGHVMTAGEQDLLFEHPVVRETVLGQLRPGERKLVPAKAARALHAAGAPVARVAAHLGLAPTGTLPGAAALLRRAAAVPWSTCATAMQVRHCSRAERQRRPEWSARSLTARYPNTSSQQYRLQLPERASCSYADCPSSEAVAGYCTTWTWF
ncbi:MAG: hypothetical protein ACR2JG_13475, partial [Geodermatophilaceae bacterium]